MIVSTAFWAFCRQFGRRVEFGTLRGSDRAETSRYGRCGTMGQQL